MKKITIKHLNLDYYYHKLENGLRVYLIPLKKKQIYVTFTTKYGGKNLVFKPANQKEFIKTPAGIAHFLEHKLFENEKISSFQFYSKTGTDCNARTSFDYTTYLFLGPYYFKKNLNYLIDNVQTLYLTEENVFKEKNIIKQEIKMRDNIPQICLFDNLYNGICFSYGIKESIAGQVKDIDQITKKDLELCYQNFYHPKNMFLVISGNIKPNETIKLIEENQQLKKFTKNFKIFLDDPDEPDKIRIKEKIIHKNVKVPKVALSFKINISHLKISYFKLMMYTYIYELAKFGWSSKLNMDLNNKKLIENDLDVFDFIEKKHWLLSVLFETDQDKKVIRYIKEKVKVFDIEQELFDRKKKKLISNYLYLPDKVKGINEKFVSHIINYGDFNENVIDKLNELNYKEFKKTILSLNFKHNNYLIIKNNLQKK